MPATKAAAAAARMLAGAVIFVPSIAGSTVLEKKCVFPISLHQRTTDTLCYRVVEEMAEKDAKKGKVPKELAAHEVPSAPKFH